MVTVKELLVKIRGDSTGLKNVGKSAGVLKGQFSALKSQIAATFGILAAGALISKSISNIVQFENALANVSTIVDTTSTNMAGMQEGILNLAGELGSATELTQGLYQAISAGVKPAESLEFIGTTAKFAKAALTDMTSAVDVTTTVINAYGKSIDEAEQITNVLFKTVELGKVTGQELASSLGVVIPTAATLGIKFEEVAAATAALTKVGLKMTVSSVSLNAALIAILKPSDEAKAKMKELGIEMSKNAIEIAGGFQPWLKKLKTELGDNNTELAKIFPNTRALRAVFSLAGNSAKEFQEILVKLRNSDEAVNIAFEKQKKTLGNTFTAIKNQVEAVLIRTFLPALQSLATWANENKTQIVAVFVGIFDAIKSVGSVVGSVISSVVAIGKAFADFAVSIAPLAIGIGTVFAAAKWSSFVLVLKVAAVNIISAGIAAVTAAAEFITLAAGMAAAKIAAIGLGPIIAGIATAAIVTYVANLAIELYKINQYISDIGKRQDFQDVLAAEKFEKTADALGLTTGEMTKLFNAVTKNGTSAIRYENALQLLKQGFLDNQKEGKNYSKVLIDLDNETEKAREEQIKFANASPEVQAMVKKLGITVDEATKKILLKKDAINKAKEASNLWKQEVESLSATIGIMGKKDVDDATRKIDQLDYILENNARQFMRNEGATKKFREELDAAKKVFIDASQKIPPKLQKIEIRFKAIEMAMRNPVALLQKLGVDVIPGVASAAEKMADESLQKVVTGFESSANKAQLAAQKLEEFNSTIDSGVSIVDSFSGALNSIGVFSDSVSSKISKLGKAIGTIAKTDFKGIASGFSGMSSIGGIASSFGQISTLIQAGATVFNTIASFFEKSTTKVAESRMRGIAGATGEWVEKIEELGNELRGTDRQARAFDALLGDIIRDTLITDRNFSLFIKKTREIFSAFEAGSASMEETAANFGSAFSAILEAAIKLGKEGGREMTGLIIKAQEAGVQVAEIAKYIADEMQKGLSGLKLQKDALDTTELQKQIADLTEEMLNMRVGSDEFIRAQEKLDALGVKLDQLTALQQIFGDKGIQVFEDMLAFENKVAENPALVNAIKGWEAQFLALSNTTRLTQEQFNDFSEAARLSYDQLIAGGFTAEEALKLMKPQLERLAYLQKEFGLEIDDATQALINQGIESGILSEDSRSDSQAMREGIESMTEAVWALVKVLGGDMPDAFNDLGKTAKGINDEIEADLEGWQDDLRKVQDEYDNTADAIGKMGDKSDDEMWRHSILPDIAKWKEGLEQVAREMEQNTAAAIKAMGDDWNKTANEFTDKNALLLAQIEEIKKAALHTVIGIGETGGLGPGFDIGNAFKLIEDDGMAAFEALKNGWAETGLSILQQTEAAKKGILDLFDSMKKGGKAGSAAFLDLIQRNDELVQGFKEIDDFVSDEMKKGFEAFKDLRSILDMSGIQGEIAAVTEEMAGLKVGTEKYIEAAAKLQQLETDLASLKELQDVFGEANIKIFEDMLAFEEKVKKNKGLTDAIDAWNKQLIAYTNTTKITQKQMTAFSKTATKSFDQLIKQGFSADEALQLMKPQLERLAMLQKEFGLEIDDSTQALIDQGIASGILKDGMIDDSTIMSNGFTDIIDKLSEIVDLFKDGLPSAAQEMGNSFAAVTDKMKSDMEKVGDSVDDSIKKIKDYNDLKNAMLLQLQQESGVNTQIGGAGEFTIPAAPQVRSAAADTGQTARSAGSGSQSLNMNITTDSRESSQMFAQKVVAAIVANEAGIVTEIRRKL